MIKPDIGGRKADIEKQFLTKTESHILKLRKAFPDEAIFGRADVMIIIDIKPSRASELLEKLIEYSVIEPVSGHGKENTDSGKNRDEEHPFSLGAIFLFT